MVADSEKDQRVAAGYSCARTTGAVEEPHQQQQGRCSGISGTSSVAEAILHFLEATEDAALGHVEHSVRSPSTHSGISARLSAAGAGIDDLPRGETSSLTGAPSPGERSPLLPSAGFKGEKVDEEGQQVHPPLVQWIWVGLLGALAYALYNIFIKRGSAGIHPILGGVILQFVAALIGVILLLLIVCHGKGAEAIRCDRSGFLWAVGAGIWVGTAEMLSFTVSGLGVAATQSIPIIIGGSVLFGALLGILMLGETMFCWGWCGIVMLTAGIAMVAMDPGEKVEEGGGGDARHAPPIYVWIWIALCCAMAYALYNICIKMGSATINPILGGVVLQFVAAIFGSALLGSMVLAGTELYWSADGAFWAVWAGVAVGSAELLSFVVNGMGVHATQSIPVLIGGSVMFGAVLGILILGEELLWVGWLGVALCMAGIGFVATDEGETMDAH